ncbi:MAG: hypothetical protein H7X79_06480 [Sporomusaceae bacterium]|nr:hypothetical protein [Sporomusaceae bacterium]
MRKISHLGLAAIILLMITFMFPVSRALAFDKPQSYLILNGDQSFPVDFLGNNDPYTVTLARSTQSCYLLVSKNEQFVQSFNLNINGGQILISNFRGSTKQDIAYACNSGDGSFFQDAKIFGYDGNKISVLLDIPNIIKRGNRAGKFIAVEDNLYLRYIDIQYVASLPKSKWPKQSHQLRVYSNGTTYWLGEREQI